jgi:hypothetical protein
LKAPLSEPAPIKERKNTMKMIILVAATALTATLVGCIVTSVHPFYTEKDLVFEPTLAGDWLKPVENSQPEIWKFEKSGNLAYRFTLIEQGKATVMEAHAFKLEGQLFLDIFSIDRDIHAIPPHYLLKVTQLTSALRMSELDNNWLREWLAANPKGAAHCLVRNGDKPDDLRVVLTGTTEELQKFILDHLNTQRAWNDGFDLRREPPAFDMGPAQSR